MNAERLLALYDRVAGAPDAVSRLRRFVLNLAVRGKLVEQDAADEPVSGLLKRIAAAKGTLKRKTGDSRIRSAADPVREDYPGPVPNTWTVQSFENLFLFIDYRGRTPPKTDGGIPLITAKNIRFGSLNREPPEFISEKTYKTWMTRGFPRIGDLFFTTEAPLANVCLNDIREPFALAQRVICLQPYDEINTSYFMFAIMSDVVQTLIGEHSTGLTAKGIKAAKLKPLPIPLPPLAEQHRIVAKVNELMALCDELEGSRKEREDTRDRLTKASFSRLTAPDIDDETFRAHAGLAVNALSALTARAEQIKQLRQTILNLAVRGKLVKQDPADEPASELLNRIAAEKTRLVKAR
ncbi:MAG: restriction endonuclease subunit S, partial [Rhodospirillaceae bacterium]|nr:restriction endonuclease subunit S [Rhodospirillaceae bacterium]